MKSPESVEYLCSHQIIGWVLVPLDRIFFHFDFF